MRSTIRVTLLGHNPIVREGLRRILTDEGFQVTQSTDDPALLYEDGFPDDLLIMIDGDQASGDSICALHTRFPAAKLVILSEAFDLESMMEAFNAGVCGYIVKEISCEPLIASLRLIAMGEKVMPSRLVDALQLQVSTEERDDDRRVLEDAHLSPRESEILACLIDGCSNKVISRRLAISEATVKVHVKAILRKLHVNNRTQAAIQGINAGMDSRQNHLPFGSGIALTASSGSQGRAR